MPPRYTFTRREGSTTVVETTALSSDASALDMAFVFADAWSTPVSVMLQTGHEVTVAPKAAGLARRQLAAEATRQAEEAYDDDALCGPYGM